MRYLLREKQEESLPRVSVQQLKLAAKKKKKNQRRGLKKIKRRLADLIFPVQECEKARIICFMYDSGVGEDVVTGGLLCQRLGRSRSWSLELAEPEKRTYREKEQDQTRSGEVKEGKNRMITESCGSVCLGGN